MNEVSFGFEWYLSIRSATYASCSIWHRSSLYILPLRHMLSALEYLSMTVAIPKYTNLYPQANYLSMLYPPLPIHFHLHSQMIV
jgi:hypothetical protein